ncbi:hypothetical protein BH18ACT9_BH18ACT9_22510 [soil metagenome]
MTIQAIRDPELSGWVNAARDAVQGALSVPVASVDEVELSEALVEVTALASQVAALKLQVLAQTDARQMAEQAAATSTDAWAAALTGSTQAVMRGGLWLARLLEEKYDATQRAFADGSLDEAQARVIVKAGERVPDSVSDEAREAAEAHLVAKAVAGMNARRLRQAARRMLDVISAELANRHEATMLDEEEQRAEVETWMTLHDNDDGTFVGRFTIPEAQGHLLRHALERLSSPNRLSRNRAGELVRDDTVPGMGQNLNWSERLGAAFVELLEHLPQKGFGGVGATLLVTMDLERLLDGLGSARLDSGARISAGEARRLACGAGIVPVVLGGASEPLDLGRRQRLHTDAMRRALAVVHDTCAAEGCERPFAWCDLHHPHAWSRGGSTSVANGLPLCGHHHRRAHDRAFNLTHLASGEVRFRRRR